MEILKSTGIRLYIANQFNGPQIREVYFTLEDSDEIVFTDITETDATRIIEHLTKLFNPSGAVPQKCHCMNADQYANCEMKCGRWEAEHGESKPVAPQAAGPVWVKANVRTPLHKNLVHIHYYTHNTEFKTTGFLDDNLIWYRKDNTDLPFQETIEWLDESNTQQLFTREDMAKAYKEGGAVVVDMMNQVHPQTFDEYMNTNYPTK